MFSALHFFFLGGLLYTGVTLEAAEELAVSCSRHMYNKLRASQP
jgi:hypothetical protein